MAERWSCTVEPPGLAAYELRSLLFEIAEPPAALIYVFIACHARMNTNAAYLFPLNLRRQVGSSKS